MVPASLTAAYLARVTAFAELVVDDTATTAPLAATRSVPEIVVGDVVIRAAVDADGGSIDAGHPRGAGCCIMMFCQRGPVKVFVAMRPVDFRKGINGLARGVQEIFGLDPFCGAVFVSRSKRADRLKLLIPTFQREDENVALKCAAEGLEHVQFLSLRVELELTDRERQMDVIRHLCWLCAPQPT